MSITDSQEPAYREEHEIDVLTKRIKQLELLVRDMLPLVLSDGASEEFERRMAALGLTEGEDE